MQMSPSMEKALKPTDEVQKERDNFFKNLHSLGCNIMQNCVCVLCVFFNLAIMSSR